MPVGEPAPCPECGAAAADGAGCSEMLGQNLAWEGDDPELAAAHLLALAPGFRAGWGLKPDGRVVQPAASRGIHRRSGRLRALDHGAPTSGLRRRAGRMFAGKRRVRRDAADHHPVLRRWDMTIRDVVAPGPAGAADRVRAWANAIRRELR